MLGQNPFPVRAPPPSHCLLPRELLTGTCVHSLFFLPCLPAFSFITCPFFFVSLFVFFSFFSLAPPFIFLPLPLPPWCFLYFALEGLAVTPPPFLLLLLPLLHFLFLWNIYINIYIRIFFFICFSLGCVSIFKTAGLCMFCSWFRCSCQTVMDDYHRLKCKRKCLGTERHDPLPSASLDRHGHHFPRPSSASLPAHTALARIYKSHREPCSAGLSPPIIPLW